MIPAFLSSALARIVITAIALVSAAAVGYGKGHSSAARDCELMRMREDHAQQSALVAEQDIRHNQEIQLQDARYQIEVMHDQHEDEIADALARNRAIVERLRKRPAARCDAVAMPEHPGSSAGADASAAAEGPFLGNVPPIPPEFAAECERVLSAAHAGQRWAQAVGAINAK